MLFLPVSGMAADKPSALSFPDTFLQSGNVDSDEQQMHNISRLSRNIHGLKQEYLETLEDTDAFNGLYLNGGYGKYLNLNNEEFFYGLEWELFDNGLYAAKRQLGKRKLETRIQFLQQLRQIYTRRKDSQISFVHQLEQEVDKHITKQKLAIVNPVVKRAEKQLAQGFITRLEFNEWKLKAFKLQSRFDYLQQQPVTRLNSSIFTLLNRIETLNLQKTAELVALAQTQSVDLQLQKAFSSRSEFLPAWQDNLSLSLYVEQYHRRTNTVDNLAGIRLRVPLHFDTDRQHVIKLDKQLYTDQANAIQQRIREKVQALVRKFHYQQQQILQFEQEHALFAKKIATLNIQKSAGLSSLGYTPEKQIPFVQLQQLDALKSALLARLQVYATVIELQAMVLPEKLMDLFQPTQPDSSGHPVVPSEHSALPG